MELKGFYSDAKEYYDSIRDIRNNPEFISIRDKIFREIEEYKSSNPGLPFLLYKARLYEIIAENFKPKIFFGCPFYFEMGLKNSKSLGGGLFGYPSMWGADMSVRRSRNLDFIKRLGYAGDGENVKDYLGVAIGPVFDEDHHCPGYTKIFEKGLSGVIRDIDELLISTDEGSEEYLFRIAAKRGLLAMIRAAERFSEEAKRLLRDVTDPGERTYLLMISDTAKVVPRNPPRNFYQGLCMLLFLYEVTDSFEGVGMSVLGHIDRLLGPLYEADLKSGAITRREAEELLSLWLPIEDIKCGAENDSWADISCTVELGGCDSSGNQVFNQVTEMVVELHQRMNLINPKLNCRVSADSPEEYLRLISSSVLTGHNVFAFINDGVIIPALVDAGKSISDARMYVNGGCQETITEGCEHSAGVMFYFSLPRVLDLSLNPTNLEGYPERLVEALPDLIEEARDFEDFYSQYLSNVKRLLAYSTEVRRTYGRLWQHSHPSPIFSSTLKGCIECGKDYTAGGARYNTATACCIGFSTLSDSLFAIKRGIFEEKAFGLAELKRALSDNFVGHEELRAKLLSYPKFGHNESDADSFAGRVFADLNNFVKTLDNERGGKYVFSTFTFANHVYAAPYVRATPDGKLSGEYLSQSVGPSRVRRVDSLTDAINAQSVLPLKESAGISVLDVLLPVGVGMTERNLAATIRAFCLSGGQALQPNFVTPTQMIEAKKEPDKHRYLLVRVCGLSVFFVNLPEHFQDDMIRRNLYNCQK